jgi:UDP-glucose 4-epimerase
MKYFVTGGAGFIGSHLVDRLVTRGQVTVYDNLSSGKREHVAHHKSTPGFKLVEGDLLDLDKLAASAAGHDIVCHLAANPDIRYGIEKTDLDLEQGTLVTYNVLESMRRCGIKRILFSSSSVVYGEATELPTPEDYGPLVPISLYGASKLACEGLVTAFSHTFGMTCWIFRFANVVGSRGTHGVILDFIEKLERDPSTLEILGDGFQRKSYLHVEDCVAGMLWAADKAKNQINIFNLGCDDSLRVDVIAEMVTAAMGLRQVRFVHTGGDRGWRGDVPAMLLSTEKMGALGWRAGKSSEEAVRKAVEELVSCRR